MKELRSSNPLRYLMSAAVNASLRQKNAAKGRPLLEFLPFSIEELKKHLEKRFEKGMSFANHGEWHIDHVFPLSLIDFNGSTDPRFLAAWSLTNLAPLWAVDNMSKGNRLDWHLPVSYCNPLLRAMYDHRDMPMALAA